MSGVVSDPHDQRTRASFCSRHFVLTLGTTGRNPSEKNTESRFYTRRSRKRTRMQCSYKTGCGLTRLFSLNWEISELRFWISPAAREVRAKMNIFHLGPENGILGNAGNQVKVDKSIRVAADETLLEMLNMRTEAGSLSPAPQRDLFNSLCLKRAQRHEARFLSCPVTS